MHFEREKESTLKKTDTGLRVRPYRDDSLPFPKFEKPFPVGFFSVNTERTYLPSAQNLLYYKTPENFPLDLNIGLSLAIKKPESAHDERIDNLLLFICDHKEQFLMPTPDLTRSVLAAEFVCWRGLLRLLMCTPYEFREDWCIHVTKYMGTFYLCKRNCEYEMFRRSQETPEQKKYCAYGFKFEQYCLSQSPLLKPDTSAPVDECAEFVCVFKTKIDRMAILYGAEMDGIVSTQPVALDKNPEDLPNLKFVELKLRQGRLNAKQQQCFDRYKTRNWWCQSFLVGIRDLFVGLRTESGLVENIEQVEVRALPKQGTDYWTPTACVSFLIEFLQVLKNVMATENCPYTTYEFYFNSKTARVTYECIRGKSEHSFLPDWYLGIFDMRNNEAPPSQNPAAPSQNPLPPSHNRAPPSQNRAPSSQNRAPASQSQEPNKIDSIYNFLDY